MPFFFPDGDAYSIYLEPLPTGGFRVTDMGSTLMALSYGNDISKLREGTRAKVFSQIINELDLVDDDGELYIDTPADDLGSTIFRFGQAITRVHDITFLNRVRVESTFYEDLESAIKDTHGEEGFARLRRARCTRLIKLSNRLCNLGCLRRYGRIAKG